MNDAGGPRKFLRELIGDNIDDNPIIETLLGAAERSTYLTPVRLLIDLHQNRIEDSEKIIGTSPLGSEGKWLTKDEVEELGLGYSGKEVAKILNDKGHFIEKLTLVKGERIPKWWIDYENIGLLDKDGVGKKWGSALESIVSSSKHLEQLKGISQRIELASQQAYETNTNGASSIEGKDNGEIVPGAVWMSFKDLRDAGTSHTIEHLKQLVASGNFKTRRSEVGLGRPYQFFVTDSNYRNLGLSRAPWETNGKGVRSDNGSKVEMEEKDNLSLGGLGSEIGKAVRVDTPSSYKENGSAQIIESRRLEFISDGRNYEFETGKSYGVGNVINVLRGINSSVFDSKSVSTTIDHLKEGTGKDVSISGKRLVPFLEKVYDILPLNTRASREYIERITGVGIDELEPLLGRKPNLRKFVHIVPGIIDAPFLLRRELGDLKQAYLADQKK